VQRAPPGTARDMAADAAGGAQTVTPPASAEVFEVLRGYGRPAVHNLSAAGLEPGSGVGSGPGEGACVRVASRRRGEGLVPYGSPVGAVRVSAGVLEGLESLIRRAPPPVVLLELHTPGVAGSGFPGGALALLQRLHAWGYTDVSHSGCGPACRTACRGGCYLCYKRV